MAKECLVCGKPLGVFSSKLTIADGPICTECWNKAGFDNSMSSFMSSNQYSSTVIKNMIAAKEKNQTLIENLKLSKKIGPFSFDDNAQAFVITKSKKDRDLYYYNQILGFELLEDGETITKGGLGSAVVGGLLFGGVGAIVGGVTGAKRTKNVCKSLQIKITLRNSPCPTEYVSFLEFEAKTNSALYKSAYKIAQDVLSALQLAVDMVNSVPAVAPAPAQTPVQAMSGADEILKYKNLLDAGIITEEEFKAKKAQILGL